MKQLLAVLLVYVFLFTNSCNHSKISLGRKHDFKRTEQTSEEQKNSTLEQVQSEDVELTQLKSDHILRNIVSKETDIIGHRLIRNLEQGETILAHMVQKIPLVKNGDRILIIAKKGSLRVTAPGVVRQNGFKNDTVRVENIHSRKIILGTVIDSRTVRINF